MRSTWFIRAGRTALAGALLVAYAGVGPASAKPAPGRPTKRSGLNLFALTFGVMNVNRIFCGINNIGEVCVDPTNSPVVGGGFWPKGTPDQYVFNSGLQLAGTDPDDAGIRLGGRHRRRVLHGSPRTTRPRATRSRWSTTRSIRATRRPGPTAPWYGIPRSTTACCSAGTSISQQDLWVRTWDGNPAFTGSARTHPIGVLVEERGLGWNFPTGNEDIIYFVYKFYNVTASSPAVYANLDPALANEIAAIGADFQARNEATYGIDIPDDGYTITNMFAAFFADMDVGDAAFNYATPVIPFAMGVTYKSDFLEPGWTFPRRHLRRAVRPVARVHRREVPALPDQRAGATDRAHDLLQHPQLRHGLSRSAGGEAAVPLPVGQLEPAGGRQPLHLPGAAAAAAFLLRGAERGRHAVLPVVRTADAEPGRSEDDRRGVHQRRADRRPSRHSSAATSSPAIPASGDTIAADPARVRTDRARDGVGEPDRHQRRRRSSSRTR